MHCREINNISSSLTYRQKQRNNLLEFTTDLEKGQISYSFYRIFTLLRRRLHASLNKFDLSKFSSIGVRPV